MSRTFSSRWRRGRTVKVELGESDNRSLEKQRERERVGMREVEVNRPRGSTSLELDADGGVTIPAEATYRSSLEVELLRFWALGSMQ